MANKSSSPALFLDRDGIVNVEVGYISKISEFEFNREIFELCRHFKKMDFKIIIVTNQSGIGRGFCTLQEYQELNSWMLDRFLSEGIKIDLVQTSTLDPNNENATDVEKWRRKPNPGMLLEAEEELNLDLSSSLLIGDNLTDIEAGLAAKVPHLFLVSQQHPSTSAYETFQDLGNCLVRLKELFPSPAN